MAVTALRRTVAVVALISLPAGCGSGGGSADESLRTDASESVDRTVREPATSTSTSTDGPRSLDGLSGELILTRQRDLLDRGLVNVQLSNDSAGALTMTSRQLHIDHFDTEPAAPRVSRIPDGRPINVQVPYGEVDDCDQPAGVSAWLEFSYTEAGSTTESTATLPLAGTRILDTIRAEQCAQRTFDDAVDATFSNPSVDGQILRVDLTFRPMPAGDVTIEIQRSFGTILVGAESPDLPATIDADATTVTVDFPVIRCDAHAMAEVTKRFGLELLVSIDGAPSRLIDVDVVPLESGLTEIVDSCRRQTSADRP